MQKRLIDWEKLAGKVGFNSYELGARCLTQEPGYFRGERMIILRAKTGGYRLYRWVGEKWMDASLDDLPGMTEATKERSAEL
jgi:hypothetical protein